MTTTRYVIDLENYGNALMCAIRSLIYFNDDPIYLPEYNQLTRRIYNELATQSVMVLDNMPDFMPKLLTLPDYALLRDITQLNDINISANLGNAFREFAMGLVFIVNKRIGIVKNTEYLLESVAEDYMVIITHSPS